MPQIKIKYFELGQKVLALLRLIRSNNLLLLIFSLYLVRLFIIGPRANWYAYVFEPEIFGLSLATVCIASAGYIINDYYDLKIDWLNKPGKVVIDYYIHRRVALVTHAFLKLLAIGIGFLYSINVVLYFLFCIFLLWFYSNRLKRTAIWGNLAISVLVALTFILPGLYYRTWPTILWCYVLFGFLTTLNREIAKDVEDIRGDIAFGCQTIPIKWGLRKTKIILILLSFFTIGLLLASLLWISLKLYAFWIIFCVIPILWIIFLIWKATYPKQFKQISFTWKLVMLAGLIGAII